MLQRNIDQIRVAVAGLGKMGGHHVRALRQLAAGEAETYYKSGLAAQVGKTRLCGVCDTAPEAAARFPGLPFFNDWQALLRTVHPDIAVLATP
ncbi:MAG: Gfo/Idh/MocA family oxidoreductase, partial [Lentisphaeria bacterium]